LPVSGVYTVVSYVVPLRQLVYGPVLVLPDPVEWASELPFGIQAHSEASGPFLLGGSWK
jgi:hypothetical protein